MKMWLATSVLLLLTLLQACVASAQSISWAALDASGGSYAGSNASISFSLALPVVGTSMADLRSEWTGFWIPTSSPPTAIEGAEYLSRSTIRAVYPNPSSGEVHIDFGIAKDRQHSETRLAVYDAQGRLEQTILRGVMTPGIHRVSVAPNPKSALSNGIHFVRMTQAGESSSQRVLVIR